MTKKEAIIKYITEMNADMLDILLDDDKSYMDVPKITFIEKLDKIFDRLKDQGISNFSRVMKGHCGGNCNNGCGGYTFLTEDNQSLDLIIEEENEEVDYRGYWEISFNGDGKTSMTGTGNSAQVISAITAIIKDFVTTYGNKIRVIEYDVQGSSGRAGVYGRIFSKLLPTWTQEDGSLHDVEVRRP